MAKTIAETKTLDQLAAEVAEDQEAILNESKDTRTRVLRMGKRLRRLQKLQKREQAETDQTWDEWIEDQKRRRAAFPQTTQVRAYMRIAEYPSAYEPGDSIKEAYRKAGEWKRNGGAPPAPKKTIKSRRLITIGAAAGKLDRQIETLTDAGIEETAKEEKWTKAEILGATDALSLLRQSCNLLLTKLKAL